MSKIEAYRTAMLARKAAAAGVTVAELLRRDQVRADLGNRAWELRANRRDAWATIASWAAQHQRTWTVYQPPATPPAPRT